MSILFDIIHRTMKDISTQNTEIQKSIAFLSEKYDELSVRMGTTEQENCSLKKQIQALDSKIDYMERNSRSSMIEINNLPTQKTESKSSLTEMVCGLGTVVGQPLQPPDIRNVYRRKGKSGAAVENTVIVEFNSSALKENIIKATRHFNKNKTHKLSTNDLGIPGPKLPVYISESLTKMGQHLYYLARKLQREKKCDGCWTHLGKIYIKRLADSAPVCIQTEGDLNRVMNLVH